MSITIKIKIEISDRVIGEIFSAYEFATDSDKTISRTELRRFVENYIHSCLEKENWYDIWEEMINQKGLNNSHSAL